MWKVFVKFGLIGIACFINLTAIVNVFAPLIGFKANAIKMISVFCGIVCILGVIGLFLYFKSVNACALKNFIHLLDRITFVLCLVCIGCAAVKVEIANAERGTELYDMINLPAFTPIIAGALLFIAEEID